MNLKIKSKFSFMPYFHGVYFFVVIPTITIQIDKGYFDFEISWLFWFTGISIFNLKYKS